MKKYISALCIGAILSLAACSHDPKVMTDGDLIAAPVGTLITAEVLDSASTSVSFETTTTTTATAPVTTIITTPVATTTTAETTTAEVVEDQPSSDNPLGETYSGTNPLADGAQDIIMDATKQIIAKENIAVRSTAYSDDTAFTSVEIAHNADGDRVYRVNLMSVKTNILLKADGTSYLFDDDEKFYVDITDNPDIDIDSIKEQGEIQVNYTITDTTMDTVYIDGNPFIRLHGTYSGEGTEQEYLLYFEAEAGFLTYIYADIPMFGATKSKMEYKEVDDSYFNITDKYAEFSFEQYQAYMQNKLSSIEVS